MTTSRIPHWLADPYSQGHYGKRAKWKTLEFPAFPRIVIQKQFYILWGIAEISAIINGLKEAEVVISSTVNWAIRPMQKADGSWTTVDYCKCNQAATPTAVAGPNEVPLLEQVNKALGSWCVFLIWQMLFPEAHQMPQSRLRVTSHSLAFCHCTGHREFDPGSGPGVMLVHLPWQHYMIGSREQDVTFKGVGSKPAADIWQSGSNLKTKNSPRYLNRITSAT